jgi:hypothetical protein
MLSASWSNADGRRNRIKARMSGLNEVPVVFTGATGEFDARIEGDQIRFEMEFENLSADLVVAHIHLGRPGTVGGVMIFLCGGGGQPDCPAATTGTITGTATAANVTGPMAQGVAPGDFEKAVQAIRSGVTYVNAHNAMFPTGEIRGHLGDFRDRDPD